MNVEGRRLKAYLSSDASYRHLGPDDGSWLAGGCWLLAAALRRALGGGVLANVVGRWGGPPLGAPTVQHVVLLLDGWVWDGDGATRPETFLRRWRTVENITDARLVEFDAGATAAAGIPPHARRVEALAIDLRAVM